MATINRKYTISSISYLIIICLVISLGSYPLTGYSANCNSCDDSIEVSGLPLFAGDHALDVTIEFNFDEVLNSETEDELPEVKFIEELKPILNFGLGAEIYISEKLNAYGSFSSDYSPFKNVSSIDSPDSSKDVNFDWGSATLQFESQEAHYFIKVSEFMHLLSGWKGASYMFK